ncbi:MAG: thiamine-phosphate kinase [Microbacterium sp.]|uniref:thiamine-phosphate kinase n=1 Tax=Microbacterium sp. TaxID=51671 RepID=UPI000C3D4436|nr:thiamine-phosphate kinase [Leifsonia sp.]
MTAPTETLASLGESGVLGRIFPRLPAGQATLLGPGDDAAILAAADGRVVVTTDTMIHGPDFRLAWSTPHDLGWKATASNLADVAAMGAQPTGLLVAVTAPAGTPVTVLEGIADGFRDACAELAPGCGVVGGDLSVSPTLTLAVTAFGDLGGADAVLRSGARPGDVVAISGALGDAARGLRLLFAEGVDADGEPDADRAAALRARHPREIEAQLAPRPPIADGPAARRAGATAMLDVSDGLLLDAARIAAASGVRIDLATAAVGDEVDLAGGEAHALLAAFPPAASPPAGFRVIGAVHTGEGVTVDGAPAEGRGGWDPYDDWDGHAG